MNSFTRGKDPKATLDIGINYSNRTPQSGRPFLVHFRLRKSCPEFYPLQKKEENGEPIIAICKSVKSVIYDPTYFIPWTVIICEIEGEDFYATMNKSGEWEISNE